MSFIVILPLLALLGLVVVFGVTYKRNGLKAAFTAAGIALPAGCDWRLLS